MKLLALLYLHGLGPVTLLSLLPSSFDSASIFLCLLLLLELKSRSLYAPRIFLHRI
uniref:Uncharacterized protein n=1 Tax=Utricularia reniformis TaxID=192314 RepID=A0A1Y0B093_9LAMI|nr:hypothetical protein AEK19_MT0542 [Utricularia reniformis]ART30798.1 hypothetical protein AEK19_MT0542 [Utricularia reniformis]